MDEIKYTTVKDIQQDGSVSKKHLQVLNYERLGLLPTDVLEAIAEERDAGRFPLALEPIPIEEFQKFKEAMSTLAIGGGPIEGLIDDKTGAAMFLSQEIASNFIKDKDVQQEAAAIAGGILIPTIFGGGAGLPVSVANFVAQYPRRAKMIMAFIGGFGGGGSTSQKGFDDGGLYAEAFGYGAREAAGEGFFQVLHKLFPGIKQFLGKFMQGKDKNLLEEGAEVAQKIVSEGGATITPGRLSKSGFIDLMEQAAEVSYAGGTKMRVAAEEAADVAQSQLVKFVTKEFLEKTGKENIEAQSNMITHFLKNASETEINLVLKEFLENGGAMYNAAIDTAYKGVNKAVQKAVGNAKIVSIKNLENIFNRQMKIFGGEAGDATVRSIRRYIKQFRSTYGDFVDFNTAKAMRSQLLAKTGAFATSGTTTPKYVNKIAGILQNAITKNMNKSLKALEESATINKDLLSDIMKQYKAANALFKDGKRTFNNSFITGLLGGTGENVTKKGIAASSKIFNQLFKSGDKGTAEFFFKLLDDAVAKKHITKEVSDQIRTKVQGSFFSKIMNDARNPADNTFDPNKLIEGIDGLKGSGKDILDVIFKGNMDAVKSFERYARAIKVATDRGIASSKGSLVLFGLQAGAIGTTIGSLNLLSSDWSAGETAATAGVSLAVLGGPYAIAKAFTNKNFVNSLINLQLSKSGTNQYARYATQVVNSLVQNGLVDPILANRFVDQAQAKGIFKEVDINKMDWYDPNDDPQATETVEESEVTEADKKLDLFTENGGGAVDQVSEDLSFLDEINGEAIVEETVSDRQPGIEEAVTAEEIIDVPKPNTEMMSAEVIQPLSGPAGMSFDPSMSTTDKLEEVGLPVFAKHGGIMSLMEQRKPKQMVS